MKTNSVRITTAKNILSLFLIFSTYWIGNNISHANVTVGFDLQVDASTDSDGNTRWEDSVSASGFEFLLDDSPAINRVSHSSSTSKFTHAYDFPGGSTGNEGGALIVTAGSNNTISFQNALGDWTNEDIRIKTRFKPNGSIVKNENSQYAN